MSQANYRDACGMHHAIYDMCLDLTEVLDQKARLFGMVGEFYFINVTPRNAWSLYFRLSTNRNSHCCFCMDLDDPRQSLNDDVFQIFVDKVLNHTGGSKPCCDGFGRLDVYDDDIILL
jgi:hypothetical protein